MSLGSFLTDVIRSKFPHVQSPEEYLRLLASATGDQQPEPVNVTAPVPGLTGLSGPEAARQAMAGYGMDTGQRQEAGLYDQGPSGTAGAIPGLDRFKDVLSNLPPEIGTRFLLSQIASATSPELQARKGIADTLQGALSAPPDFAPVNISPQIAGEGITGTRSVPNMPSTPSMPVTPTGFQGFDYGGKVTQPSLSPDLIRSLALRTFSAGGNPADVTALMNIGKGETTKLAKGEQLLGPDNSVIASNQEPPTFSEAPHRGINPATGKPEQFIVSKDGTPKWLGYDEAPPLPSPNEPLTTIYDPNSPTGTRNVTRQEAVGKPGPMTANSPAPAESDTSRQANAARVAAGEPLTQVFPGYRGNVMAQRDQARNDAIAKIISENPGMSAADAGVELSNRTIAFQSGKKSAGQLTTMLGATRQAVGQLDFNIAKAKEEMAKLGSSDLSPILNAIARGEEKWTGNPAYSSLFYYMHATAVESARILSGGQASTAQLHQGAMEEAQKWSGINMTPASFNAVADAMHAEGISRTQTYVDALNSQRVGGGAGSAAAAPPAAGGAQPAGVIQYDKQGRRIK